MADPHVEFTMAEGKRVRLGLPSLERLREAVLAFLSDPDDAFVAEFSDRQAGFTSSSTFSATRASPSGSSRRTRPTY